MQRLEVSGAVRPIYGSLGVKRLIHSTILHTIYLPTCHSPTYTHIFLVVPFLKFLYRMQLYQLPCVLHASTISPFSIRSVNYDSPHYAVFSIFLSPTPAQLRITNHSKMQLANIVCLHSSIRSSVV
jgi:hypothetical protein